MQSDTRHHPKQPPRPLNFEGRERRVGIEIEFAALSAFDVAHQIRLAFGGQITRIDPHCFLIRETEFGDFKAELDTRYAHRQDDEPRLGNDPISTSFDAIIDVLRQFYGDISSVIVPCEIVTPPLRIDEIAKLDAFINDLTAAGAQGTASNPFYAFGTHLNPDIATEDPAWILAVMKAEILLSDWLRSVMAIDLTRRITSFADPFPRHYIHEVLQPGYWPNRPKLVADYLRANPTRDRELDMLPLFAWQNESVIRRILPSVKVKKRPTFHYRLPNANLGVEGWSIGLEWNRWCLIERLAENTELLGAMGEAYLENDRRLLPERWAMRASEWLLLS
jgi:hypothetical protein